MEKKGWKVLAIVFMSLFGFCFLSFIGMIMLGTSELAEEQQDLLNEESCIWDVCIGDETYHYNTYTNKCSCYLDSELTYSEVLD